MFFLSQIRQRERCAALLTRIAVQIVLYLPAIDPTDIIDVGHVTMDGFITFAADQLAAASGTYLFAEEEIPHLSGRKVIVKGRVLIRGRTLAE